jgi:hypothetical protein
MIFYNWIFMPEKIKPEHDLPLDLHNIHHIWTYLRSTWQPLFYIYKCQGCFWRKKNINNSKQNIFLFMLEHACVYRDYDREVQWVHWSRTRRAEKRPWISVGTHSLSHRRFLIFKFFGVFSTQIFNFHRNLSLFPGPKSSLVPPCKISLGGPMRVWKSIVPRASCKSNSQIILPLTRSLRSRF